MITQYVRDTNNNPVGVVVASEVSSNKWAIGWSACNVKKGDVFDKVKGKEIAYRRLTCLRPLTGQTPLPPANVQNVINSLKERGQKYFAYMGGDNYVGKY